MKELKTTLNFWKGLKRDSATRIEKRKGSTRKNISVQDASAVLKMALNSISIKKSASPFLSKMSLSA